MAVNGNGVDKGSKHGELKDLMKILNIDKNLSITIVRLKANIIKRNNEVYKELKDEFRVVEG